MESQSLRWYVSVMVVGEGFGGVGEKEVVFIQSIQIQFYFQLIIKECYL